MYSWGYNNWGQLGNNTTTTATKPVKVSNITNVAAISANYYNSMAMTSDGSVYTWGWNEYVKSVMARIDMIHSIYIIMIHIVMTIGMIRHI